MIQTQVSSKYQVVIPKKVRQKLELKPGQKLNVYLLGNQVILTPRLKWPEGYLEDLKGLWKKIDVKTFLAQERDSWQ